MNMVTPILENLANATVGYFVPQKSVLAKLPEMGPEVINAFANDEEVEIKKIKAVFACAAQMAGNVFTLLACSAAASYIISKYTPIFASVFKVNFYISAYLSYEVFTIRRNIHKEYLALELQWLRNRKAKISLDEFRDHVENCALNILTAATVLNQFTDYTKDFQNLGKLVDKLVSNEKDNKGKTYKEIFLKQIPSIYKVFALEVQMGQSGANGGE